MHPDLEAPIIIIGNGGSGTSLLDRMLNAHPAIAMKGEMKFLIPKVWQSLWAADANTTLRNLKQHFETDPELENRLMYSPAEHQRFLEKLAGEEYLRTGAALRRCISEWFCLGEKSAPVYWGFKEIMNGAVHRYSWETYDYLFPRAYWLHIVRHPLHQIRAQARMSKQALTLETTKEFLDTWLAIVEMSRKRASTGRYLEIRYEDLIRAPQVVLSPVLQALGLAWGEECRRPLARQWGAKSEDLPLPPAIHQVIAATPKLEECMASMGYLCEREAVERMPPPESPPPIPNIFSVSAGSYALGGTIQNEQGQCWEFDFSCTELAAMLHRTCDDLGAWRRSPLRLFENDAALTPAHALHFRIRELGGGAYSHWQNRLLFSTSDNTDPNTNGRVYSFDLGGK
jgi:hypothetical protein